MKICHVTSVHETDDIRIFYKECTSLAAAGYETYLVGKGNRRKENGVHVIGYGKSSKNRLKRMRLDTKRAYALANALDCDIYHLHDPELLPYALKLKKNGKKVVFDSHEDIPSQILQKNWLLFPKFISLVYKIYEKYVLKKVDVVISVSPNICDRLKQINSNVILITNYPLLSEADYKFAQEYQCKSDYFCFAGSIDKEWMHHLIIEVLQEIPDMRYELYGPVEQDYLDKLILIDQGKHLDYRGKIPHDNVKAALRGARAGLAIDDYCPNSFWNIGTLGNNKLFEVFAAGIPVICTDFKLWKEIIEEYKCGIIVKPNDRLAIKNAMIYILENPKEAQIMGCNGRKAVREKYNWSTQEKVLLDVYQELWKQ